MSRLLRPSLSVGLSLVALIGTVALIVVEPDFVETVRNAAFDSYQKRKPRTYRDAPVRVIDIDDESLARVGQWPWPRDTMAILVDRLGELGASAIALDILFAEPDQTSPPSILRRYESDQRIAAAIADLPDHDELFAKSVGRQPVITSFVLSSVASEQRPPIEKASFAILGDDPAAFLPQFPGSVSSLEGLSRVAVGNGAMNVVVSRDGVVRKVQLLLVGHGSIYPTLTAEALRVGAGESTFVVKSSGASGESRLGESTGLVSIRVGDVITPTDPQGGVLLHYSEPRPERYLAAWKILSGDVEPGELEGHIVFVGTSAAGLKDLRLDPLGNAIAGAEVHAQAIEQILQGTYLIRPDWARAVEILLLFALWVVLLVTIPRLGALWSGLFGAVAVGSVAGVSWWAFSAHRLLLDPVLPAVGTAAIYITVSLAQYFESQRRGRWIREAFSSYISPNLVEYLIENPDQLDLGGERRECSFVMTDLASFTSMVEKADPGVIVAILNEYIEGMVKVALETGGTLDRIVGDAVAVMFSAPIPQEDHSRRAVDCALAMDRYSVGFRAAKAEEGLEIGITRIGVHTGTVTIGNIGGDTFFDYRALGDAVNTAARLETVNGQLGTRVCISGATIEQCPGFVGRPIGRLVLKGKTEGIMAFEPLAQEEANSDRVREYLAAHDLMAREEPDASTAFRAFVERYPEDPLGVLHLGRLDAGEAGDLLIFKKK